MKIDKLELEDFRKLMSGSDLMFCEYIGMLQQFVDEHEHEPGLKAQFMKRVRGVLENARSGESDEADHYLTEALSRVADWIDTITCSAVDAAMNLDGQNSLEELMLNAAIDSSLRGKSIDERKSLAESGIAMLTKHYDESETLVPTS